MEAADVEAAGDDVAAIGLGAEIALRLVLVVDLTDNLFHHVLHSDDAGGRSVFIHHYGHVRAFFLHLAQQIVDRLSFGNGANRARDVADFALRALFVAELEHVADVHEARDLIDIIFVNRNARVLLMDHDLAQLLERCILADGDNARARRHDFADRRVAERDYRLDQLAVALFNDAFFFTGGDQGVNMFLGSGGFLRLRMVTEIEHGLQEVKRPR